MAPSRIKARRGKKKAKASRSGAPSASRAAPAATPQTTRRAEVVLDVEAERGRVHLVLANCGDAVATDVRVEFSRPLRGPDRSTISELPVFQRLGVLRPGRALRVFWDSAPALLAGKETGEFVATVTWNESARQGALARYRHDLNIFRVWPEHIEDATG